MNFFKEWIEMKRLTLRNLLHGGIMILFVHDSLGQSSGPGLLNPVVNHRFWESQPNVSSVTFADNDIERTPNALKNQLWISPGVWFFFGSFVDFKKLLREHSYREWWPSWSELRWADFLEIHRSGAALPVVPVGSCSSRVWRYTTTKDSIIHWFAKIFRYDRTYV